MSFTHVDDGKGWPLCGAQLQATIPPDPPPTPFTFAPVATAMCRACKSLAAWHLGGEDSDTLCGTPWFDPKKLTAVALEADCENCRAHPSVMVGPVSQKGCARREAPTWEPKPMPGVVKRD